VCVTAPGDPVHGCGRAESPGLGNVVSQTQQGHPTRGTYH